MAELRAMQRQHLATLAGEHAADLMVAAFGEDQNGELYLVSQDGTIYRLVAA